MEDGIFLGQVVLLSQLKNFLLYVEGFCLYCYRKRDFSEANARKTKILISWLNYLIIKLTAVYEVCIFSLWKYKIKQSHIYLEPSLSTGKGCLQSTPIHYSSPVCWVQSTVQNLYLLLILSYKNKRNYFINLFCINNGH